MDEVLKERQRMELEDVVMRLRESGWTEDDIKSEVEYVLETMDA